MKQVHLNHGILDQAFDRLDNILKDIPNASKQTNGSDQSKVLENQGEPAVLRISEVVEPVGNEFLVYLENSEKDIEFKMKFENHSANKSIFADKVRFQRVLMNLLKNSEESMDKASGKIFLNATVENNRLSLVIEDNGRGIDPKNVYLIEKGQFTDKPESDGIGISSSIKYLESWDGELRIESEQGQGSRVLVQLPVVCGKI